ncbi:MAG: RNA polymerase sigma factor [Pseudomonadota bacterium]
MGGAGSSGAAADAAPDDTALLILFANGDPDAARQLTHRLAPRTYSVALRMLGNSTEAEDVAQEAMMRLWKIAPNWEPGRAKISTWLYRVTMNLCLDVKRRRRQVDLDAVPELADPASSVADQMQERSRQDALQDALMQLPDRQRQAVVLRHIEDLSNPEIAGIMEISVEAVESLTARGKRALSAALSGRRAELGYQDG